MNPLTIGISSVAVLGVAGGGAYYMLSNSDNQQTETGQNSGLQSNGSDQGALENNMPDNSTPKTSESQENVSESPKDINSSEEDSTNPYESPNQDDISPNDKNENPQIDDKSTNEGNQPLNEQTGPGENKPDDTTEGSLDTSDKDEDNNLGGMSSVPDFEMDSHPPVDSNNFNSGHNNVSTITEETDDLAHCDVDEKDSYFYPEDFAQHEQFLDGSPVPESSGPNPYPEDFDQYEPYLDGSPVLESSGPNPYPEDFDQYKPYLDGSPVPGSDGVTGGFPDTSNKGENNNLGGMSSVADFEMYSHPPISDSSLGPDQTLNGSFTGDLMESDYDDDEQEHPIPGSDEVTGGFPDTSNKGENNNLGGMSSVADFEMYSHPPISDSSLGPDQTLNGSSTGDLMESDYDDDEQEHPIPGSDEVTGGFPDTSNKGENNNLGGMSSVADFEMYSHPPISDSSLGPDQTLNGSFTGDLMEFDYDDEEAEEGKEAEEESPEKDSKKEGKKEVSE